MLSVVPGISTSMARSLLAAYGSLAAAAAVAPEGLRDHPGIGQVRAARLAEVLHGGYVAHSSTASRIPSGRPAGYDRRAAGSSPTRPQARNCSPPTVEPSPCVSCDRPLTAPS